MRSGTTTGTRLGRRGAHNGGMVEQSVWMQKVAADPGHSAWYIDRMRGLARAGDDLAGEARLIDAMAERGSHVLDAGCGPGRVAGALAAAGHDVVGVDVDPALIEAAQEDHPGPRWIVEDLAELDLSAHGISTPFDVIVCAGNVMTFLAPSTRGAVLRRFREHLAPHGRVTVGFGTGRGYEPDEFFADAAAAGLAQDLVLGTWDLRPRREDSSFLVAVLSHASDDR
ncbi:methyltransferase family protein [Saccharopolyspora dendranthemae]|uniref:Methyltransferase family protein n=2 Tax=Saccharopolyspora dendranthemae TaxID=1181886 RepID=A0A561U7K0_9PSEU|nr:methyltransferase family protein [Saccharopolyspora dendranthemae]